MLKLAQGYNDVTQFLYSVTCFDMLHCRSPLLTSYTSNRLHCTKTQCAEGCKIAKESSVKCVLRSVMCFYILIYKSVIFCIFLREVDAEIYINFFLDDKHTFPKDGSRRQNWRNSSLQLPACREWRPENHSDCVLWNSFFTRSYGVRNFTVPRIGKSLVLCLLKIFS